MADPVADAYLKQVDLVEHDLVSLARAMPAGAYDFRPTGGAFDDVRTFGEQVMHTATLIFLTAAIVLEEKSPYGPGVNDNGPAAVQGKDQIVEYLEASIRYARKAMASLTQENHLDPLRTYLRDAAAHRGSRGRRVPQLQPLRPDGRLRAHERRGAAGQFRDNGNPVNSTTALVVVAGLAFAACLTVARPASAQGSYAYLSLGAGAAGLSGGVDLLVAGTPVAIGAELGVGTLLMASLAASYQPFAGQLRRKVHPFLRVSLAGVSSSPYSAGCVGLGGGVAYWPRSRRIGLRLEASKLLPAFKEELVDETFVPPLWTIRAGVAFGW